MSKYFKIGLALASSFFVTTSLFAQATIEEVIVTAQRTEQSLQDVPIAVSAFTDEVLAERQIEYASDIQLQVPGVNFTATQFGAGGFSIRGITNLATAASADAGVEIHLNGLPLGLTSVSEIQYLDMERLEVLRGPQGTLFGRNATGGVINLITAKPTLDEFYGSADIKYGQDAEKMITLMMNVPITDQLGFRFAYTNLEKDGVMKNTYSRATNDFDNRDGYQWRASFLYEFDDTLRLTAVHNAYDEESARNQVSGVFCETGGSLTQGCVVGGQQVFEQISPMSNGSTLPSLLGGNLGFYMPGNLGCTAAANDGTCYNPLATGFDGSGDATLQGLYDALVSVSNIPNEFFSANLWRSPIHEAQESTSQLLLEKDFDQGQLTAAASVKKRVFYRDTSSLSKEALSIRWSAGLQANNALYLADGATLAGITGDAASAMPMVGVPLGYSNYYQNPECDMDAGKTGVFGGATCIRGFHELPVSGDASFSDSTSQVFELKYASDLDGMFNFLVGAIDISTKTNSFYDVYASGITMNGLQLPASISKSYRDAFYKLAGCALVDATANGYAGPCATDGSDTQTGAAVVAGIGITSGTITQELAAAFAADPTVAGGLAAMQASQTAALDKISRIDGVYTEHFHNETKPFKLDSRAIFTEFYFDVAEGHKLTLGLRYTEDHKDVRTRATFYDTPLVSAWTDAQAGNCGIGQAGAASVAADGTVTPASAACLAIGSTKGQQIGVAPSASPLANAATNSSQYLILGLDAFNADYGKVTPAVIPQLDFSKTTGRLVWDWAIDDNTLMYVSYAHGFKGGGFNPPFNAAQFPNTPFAFDSTEVDSLELGIKATVPEIGLVANASFYYNDFENFHLGSIRNETAINYGIPLESYGAELELLLNPPSVPGLSFNMQLSLYDSEIGDVSIVNPHDLAGHYNGLADSANWHIMKSPTANSFLVDKSRFGYMYGSILQYQATKAAQIAAAADPTALTAAEEAAMNTALATLGQTNEFAAAVMLTAAGAAAANTADLDGSGAVDAADAALAQNAARDATDAAAGFIITPELNAAATAYGTKAQVCHMIQVSATANINTCLPDAAAAGLLVGANVATAHDPAATLIHSPVTLAAGGQTLAKADSDLLPSIGVLGSGASLQTGGLCTLWGMFTADYSGAAATAALGGAHTSALTGDDAANPATTGIVTNANEACYGTATKSAGLISSGNEQSLKGNPMPFSDVTLSLGIAYTFQANNVEVTPRLDYYYRSEATQGVFNIQQNKVPAWDEINFRLNIVPTNGDWRIVFYGQNLTDERNITATAITNSSTSHTNSTFVREPRSFGFQFGIDF